MIYLNNFDTHTSYDAEVNRGGQEFKIPNVSYCKDVKDVHFNPYNLIKFYVGEITPPQTVKIYTDETNHLDVTVNEGKKWYTYVLPKDKGLYNIVGDSVKNVVVKTNITTSGETIIPISTVKASFKGSNTSNVTNMSYMFNRCSGLTSLDLSGWNTSNVKDMNQMFYYCNKLETLDLSGWDTSKVTDMNGMFGGCSNSLNIRMIGCSLETVEKIQNQLNTDGITGATINQ